MGVTIPSRSATTSAFVLLGSGHSSRGLSMMKLSATLGGMGSVAISPLPIFVNTRSTSGIARISASSCSCRSMACCNEVPGMRRACIVMSPSSRLGTNSVPRRVANSPVATTIATAAATVSQRKRTASETSGL